MRVIAAAVIVAFLAGTLAGPAFGQAQQPIPRYGEKDKEKTPQELQAERDAEAAYKRSLGNIPAQKTVDPWGNVRGDSPPKQDTKAPSKKTKTGASSH